jgi:hypothetical protein
MMYEGSSDSYPNHLYLVSVEKAPVLFFTCQEARTEVKRVYQPFRVCISHSKYTPSRRFLS